MDFTLNSSAFFPVGTVVKAYLASNWSHGLLPPSGAPLGPVVDEAAVAADGTIELTGLDVGETYYAAADVAGAWRYVRFSVVTPPSSGEGASQGELEEVQGEVEDLADSVGVANGIAALEAAGKVPVAQLPSAIMEYQGAWNAATNTPKLEDGKGNNGDVYRVTAAAERNLGSGVIAFEVGDYAIYNGATWEKSDTTDAVASVAGKKGAVKLVAADIEGLVAELAAKQAHDVDLDEIAAVATKAFGRSLLTAENAAAARALLESPASAVLAAKVGPIKEQVALQNITGLLAPIGASATERWHLRFLLVVEAANVNMDLNLGLTFPAGCTGYWGAPSIGWSAVGDTATPVALVSIATPIALGTRIGVFGVPVNVILKGGGTAGNVQIQYAQLASNPGDLSILDGSALVEARKLAA